MKRKELIKLRAGQQLKDHKGGQIINPLKRLKKKKPYTNRDYQAVYEYTRININGPDTIFNDKNLLRKDK